MSHRKRLSIAGQIASLNRHHPDDSRIPVLRKELAVAELCEHVERLAPEMTAVQREGVARFLLSGGTAA
ncbi:hypothetical protein [Pseudonocardia oroxyli]|uniref:Uncharacterized protein n=1 Tax=Pseudonocardia oroxyli TaxID=366584 RepID=A0A1G7YL61_PSEOR|nr:hypothetical protein [Pseudonocardia oroxyli]SDG97233.1 hypothetical protein SAMN05216377_11789 [Pseudonocardia oroxyli]